MILRESTGTPNFHLQRRVSGSLWKVFRMGPFGHEPNPVSHFDHASDPFAEGPEYAADGLTVSETTEVRQAIASHLRQQALGGP